MPSRDTASTVARLTGVLPTCSKSLDNCLVAGSFLSAFSKFCAYIFKKRLAGAEDPAAIRITTSQIKRIPIRSRRMRLI